MSHKPPQLDNHSPWDVSPAAAAALTGTTLSKARTTTIRATLINIPARIAYSARIHTLHLPAGSRRETLFNTMFAAVMAPPQAA